MNHLQNVDYFQLPITSEALGWARRFAADQISTAKKQRVFLNTLAVYTVHSYLQIFDIATDLESSDSWNPGLASLMDVADLVIPELDNERLECRPVFFKREESFRVPEAAESDRIGYVAVGFDDDLNEAYLLGYQSVFQEEIAIKKLKPIEDLFDYFELIQGMKVNPVIWIKLSLDEVPPGLESGESLLADRQIVFKSGKESTTPETANNSDSYGEIIELGNEVLRFVIRMNPVSEHEVDITLWILADDTKDRLPDNLVLSILDEYGNSCIDEDNEPIQATPMENRIKLNFSAEQGDKFKAKITLGDLSLTKNFIIEQI